MLRVSTQKEKASLIWIPVGIATVLMHIGFFVTAVNVVDDTPRTVYEPSRVEFRTIAPPSEPLPEPEPEPEPVIAKKRPAATPKPNMSNPKPGPAKTSEAPPKPVFGVTADSVAKGESGVAVRIGNTLAKKMDKTYTRPKNVQALPVGPKSGPVGEAPGVTKPKKTKTYAVYELSKTPSFKIKIEPKYPDQARRRGVEGIVQLEVLIDEQGRVRKVNVLKSPGHGLERAAITALNKSKFNPGFLNGKAVPVRIKIPYRFLLDS